MRNLCGSNALVYSANQKANMQVVRVNIEGCNFVIKTCLIDNETFYCASDIAKTMRLRSGNLIRYCPSMHVKKGLGSTYADRERRFVNRQGLQFIFRRMVRTPQVDNVAKELGLDMLTIVRGFVPELETIKTIRRAFPSIESICQFQFGPFRIDLYFPLYTLAIECDENRHVYHVEDDEKRQVWLEKNLGCKFIRFNPEHPTFDIIDVIGQISAVIHDKVLMLQNTKG
jgi:very-short-patch-repair endonuclease